MKENILRVAAYARVSTDKEDQTNSLLSQRSYFADLLHIMKVGNLVKCIMMRESAEHR